MIAPRRMAWPAGALAIDVVLVVYSARRFPAFARALGLFGRLYPMRTIVAVINGAELAPDRVSTALDGTGGSLAVLRHDNAGAEFGAYQKGLDAVLQADPDRVVLMNDTVGSHQPVSAQFFRSFLAPLRPGDKTNVATGTIDHSERALSLRGRRGSRWIRSNLVGLDRDALATLGGTVYDPAVDSLVEGGEDLDTFFSPGLEPGARAHVERWLFSDDEHRWYNAQPLSAKTSGLMALKARSVLHEMDLSMRLDSGGTAFVPIRDRYDRALLALRKVLT